MCLTPQAGFRRSSRNFREGVSAGTGLDRLNMLDLQALARPISFEELENGFSAKLRPRLRRIPSDGSMLPPKTLGAFVDRIVELDGSVAGRSARFLDCRLEALRRHGRLQRKNPGQNCTQAVAASRKRCRSFVFHTEVRAPEATFSTLPVDKHRGR